MPGAYTACMWLMLLHVHTGSGVSRLVPVPLHQQAHSLAQLGLYEEALDVAGQLPDDDDMVGATSLSVVYFSPVLFCM